MSFRMGPKGLHKGFKVAEQEAVDTPPPSQQPDDAPDLSSIYSHLQEGNRRLATENQVLTNYMRRVSAPLYDTTLQDMSALDKLGHDRQARLTLLASSSQTLTPDDLADIIQSEVYMLRTETSKVKAQTEEQIHDLRAMLEGVEESIKNSKRDIYDFKREIIIGAEDEKSGKIAADKMISYLEARKLEKDQAIEKIHMKYVVLKGMITKLEHKLSEKEENGEDLHMIDFDQLKIENQQYLERIEEKNKELLGLKLTTGKTVQILNALKNKLNELSKQSDFLHKQLVVRQEQLTRVDQEVAVTSKDARVLEAKRKTLKIEEQDPDAPSIVDYVKLKVEVGGLERERAEWQRKVDIASREQDHADRMLSTARKSRMSNTSRGGGVMLL